MPRKKIIEDADGEFEQEEQLSEEIYEAEIEEPALESVGGLRMTAEVVQRWLSVGYERKSNAFPAVLVEPGSIPSKRVSGMVLNFAFRAAMNGGYVYVPEEYAGSQFLEGKTPESKKGNYFAFHIEK